MHVPFPSEKKATTLSKCSIKDNTRRLYARLALLFVRNDRDPPPEKVKSSRTGSLFQNLKARLLQLCGPPRRATGAGVHEQRPEGELKPRFFADENQQKIPAGFYHAGGFGQRFLDPLAVDMIDGIRAYDGIERSRLERKFAHVAGLDCDALFHTRGLQVSN
jgi:hypothetical protein